MSESMGAEARPAEDASPGALLKRERERRSLTVQQAAEALHLDPWIVEAIEADRFQVLGAPVYARGHLRKYAAQLGLSADDVLQRYESLQDRPTVIDPIPAALADPVRAPRRSLKRSAWTAIGIIVVASLAWTGYEAWQKHDQSATVTPVIAPAIVAEPALEGVSGPTTNAEPTSTPGEAPAVGTEEPTEPGGAVSAAASAAPAAPSAPAGTYEVAGSAAPEGAPVVSTAATGGVEVRLEFSGDSWTEVVDATGARLMYGMGSPGRVRTLTGVPPLQVTLGSVSAVKMQINGEAVAVPRREGREYSRFTIDADGNLR